MMRGKWKEAVLLLLPVVAIMCVALWWQQKEKRDVVTETGPLRLEVEKIVKVKPTPAEVAEGYDTKYVVSFKRHGKNPFPSPNELEKYHLTKSISARNVELKVRENNQWRTFSAQTSPPVRIVDYFETKQIGINQLLVLLPLAKLPDKDTRLDYVAYTLFNVRVPKGSVQPQGKPIKRISPSARPGFDIVTVDLASPQQSLVVHTAGEPVLAPNVSRARPISFKAARLVRWKPIAQRNSSELELDLRIDDWRTKIARSSTLKVFDAHLIDEKGRIYRTHNRADGRGKEEFVSTPRGYLNTSIITEKERFYRTRVFVRLNELPADAGQVIYRANFSVDESWPLPVSVIVRERSDWTLRRSKDIKLRSITARPIQASNSAFAVRVELEYSGQYELMHSGLGGDYFFDRWAAGMGEVGISYPDYAGRTRPPQSRLFVTDWSQRIESASKNVPLKPTILPLRETEIKVKKVQCEKFCTIDYTVDLSTIKLLPPALVFKADIGVEGDGFLPVSVPLPPALVAKTAATPLP